MRRNIKGFSIGVLSLSLFIFIGQSALLSDEPEGLQVYIRMNKRIFHADEKVIVHICVQNRSSKDISFDIYDRKGDRNTNYITFQPVVMDFRGREAEIIVPYRLEEKNPQDIIKEYVKRTVNLGVNEEIVHRVDLKHIYNLKYNKNYRIRGFLYPHFEEKKVIQSDNEISFKISDKHLSYIKSGIVPRRKKRIFSPRMIPSEVVFLVLSGEKNKSLDRFIKYFDIEKFINSYPNFVRRYNIASMEKKSQIEDEFITFLLREREDYIIDFKVEKQHIGVANNVAYVDVIVDRFALKKSDRYMYRYTLEKTRTKKGDSWLIINLEASVMRGKKL